MAGFTIRRANLFNEESRTWSRSSASRESSRSLPLWARLFSATFWERFFRRSGGCTWAVPRSPSFTAGERLPARRKKVAPRPVGGRRKAAEQSSPRSADAATGHYRSRTRISPVQRWRAASRFSENMPWLPSSARGRRRAGRRRTLNWPTSPSRRRLVLRPDVTG